MRLSCLTLFGILLLTAWAGAAHPPALRSAVEDLMQTYGDHYPNGPAFLDRLDSLETQLQNTRAEADRQRIEADLAQLQQQALTAHPLLVRQPILFVVRHQYRKDHHNTATFFPAAQHEYNNGAFTPGGALKLIDFSKHKEVRTLLQIPHGVARDPDVHFDGTRIVFSMRTNAADSYHIYELNTVSSQLRQLTSAPDVDDLDPLYLPDNHIAFSSTREPKYCMCNRHIMANLFRMDADGANIHQIGKSTLFEGHGNLMPDGRILYDRWEYVDRNFGDAQSLWTVNPDGSNHALYWGNNTASPGAVLEARILPGTQRALCVFSSCHDRPWGALAIIDRQQGLDGPDPVLHIWPADAAQLIRQSGWQQFDLFTQVKLKYEDPYPLSDTFFLASRMTGQGEQMGLYLLDLFGNEILLHSETPGCFDPMPLSPRPRPHVIPTRRNFDTAPGFFYVQDVYQGTHMQGVQRGSVKSLRVVESPEKRFWTDSAWNGQGQEAPAMNWHDFNNKRILGTVPVEPDGSASFAVPSDRFVYFQLLDENGLMIQSMRSGTMVQSGEQASCIGCHDDRRTAPPASSAAAPLNASHPNPPLPMALRRKPSTLLGWHGPARDFNYLSEVQPVFDQHCVRCHDFNMEAGHILNLAPDRNLVFNTSYNELWRKQFIRTVGAGPSDTQPARTWGSHASRLITAIRQEHCKVKLPPQDLERIAAWIDLNAPYYPSYASAYPNNLAGRAPLTQAQLTRLAQLTDVPLLNTAAHHNNLGPQISFDRPELSPCLQKFPNPSNPKRLEALSIIQAGHSQLNQSPQADRPHFQPSKLDQWREAKYQSRLAREWQNRQAIRHGQKIFDHTPHPSPVP